MSWKTTGHNAAPMLAVILLFLSASNVWLSLEFPFFFGHLLETPIGAYRLRLVSYEVTDYGSTGSVQVINEFGSLADGLAVALGRDVGKGTDANAYPLRRDYSSIAVFVLYLASLLANILLPMFFISIAIKNAARNW